MKEKNIENIATQLKAIAFEQMIDALRACTSDDLRDVLAEVETLMKVVKTMVHHSIEMNMLYNDLMIVHCFVAGKLLKCDD